MYNKLSQLINIESAQIYYKGKKIHNANKKEVDKAVYRCYSGTWSKNTIRKGPLLYE